MIVVDTNVLAYLVLEGGEREAASAVLRRDPEWAAPWLWRSEMCNLLARRVRGGAIASEDATEALGYAEGTLSHRQFPVDPGTVLRTAVASGCTAYDCEFVVLARELGVPLVTGDAQVLRAFPREAVSMARFAR